MIHAALSLCCHYWIVRAVTGGAGVNVGGGGGKGESCVLGKVGIQQVQGVSAQITHTTSHMHGCWFYYELV